jgi:hypothetical protein
MEGLRELFEDGEPDGVVLEMVIAGLARAGRLRDSSEILLEAITAGWVGIVSLDKTTAILAGLAMKCAKEDDYAREFVEVCSIHLCRPCPCQSACSVARPRPQHSEHFAHGADLPFTPTPFPFVFSPLLPPHSLSAGSLHRHRFRRRQPRGRPGLLPPARNRPGPAKLPLAWALPRCVGPVR